MRLFRVVKGSLAARIREMKISKLNPSALVQKQVDLFEAIGLDWNSAHQMVVELDGAVPETGSLRSQHYELFAALGMAIQPKRILEIGTSDASFVSFLSKAFPGATIETIDLPDGDKRFWNAIDGRQEVTTGLKLVGESELIKRKENLRKSSNVIFRQVNSLSLCRFEEEKYDLIWLDGDHTFPIVACDIANAVRLLNQGGTLVCDDVFLVGSVNDNDGWGSWETKMTLQAFAEANIISTHYVLKRLSPHKNFNAKVQKHLAVCKLL